MPCTVGACLNMFVFIYNNFALFTIIYNIYKRLALSMIVCIPGRSGNLFWFSDIFYLPYFAIPDLQGLSATNAKHLSALKWKCFNIRIFSLTFKFKEFNNNRDYFYTEIRKILFEKMYLDSRLQ